MNPQQMQQYRQYQQPVQNRSPAAIRRPGQPPVQAQQYAVQQQQQLQAQQAQQAQQRNAAIEYQNAQRRARRPTDKNMPEGVEDMVIGDGVQQYKDLREQERRLDFAMMRKRLDMQEYSRSHKRQKTMRLFISNLCENQIWQNPPQDFSAVAQHGMAKVRIEGRLLEDDDEDEDVADTNGESAAPESTKLPTRKMTSFFKSMTVEFDRSHNTTSDPHWQVEWKKQPGASNSDLDAIEFRRPCEENMNINIILVRDEEPARYRLSPMLAQTLDMEEADRAEVVMALWDYARCMNLQEDEEKRTVRCDGPLRKIPDLITHHLTPLPPLVLNYTVRVDQAFHEANDAPLETIYDVHVSVDSPVRQRVLAMLQNPEVQNNLRQIGRLDDELATVVQALQTSKARHNFYRALAKDPVGFTKQWMNSQRRDLEVILGEAGRGGGEDGSGPEFARGGQDGVWGSAAVNEAVRHMLARPAQRVQYHHVRP